MLTYAHVQVLHMSVRSFVRVCVPTWNETAQGVLTSVAAWTTAFVFFSSSVYHVTAPDRFVSMFTRFLDFAAIYLGIVVSATADIAVATRGFDAVPVVTIVDLPVAGLIVVLFFLWRRHRLRARRIQNCSAMDVLS